MARDKIGPLSALEVITERSDCRLQLTNIAMIGDNEVGRGEPLRPARLRSHSTTHICFIHPSLHGPPHPDLIIGIHHDHRPTHRGCHDRRFDDCHARKPLQRCLDTTEDQGMSDRFQSPELARVGENDPSQRLAVYLAFEDDARPPLGDRGEAFVGQNGVTDGVRVDGVNAPLRQ